MTRFSIYLSVGIMIWGKAYLAEAAAPPRSGVPETFLDADTIAVVRINFETLDVQGLRDWALSTLHERHVDRKAIESFAEEMRGAITKADNWQQNFRRAGANNLYIVVHKPIIANLPLIVVPLEKGTNPDAVAAQLEAAEIIHLGSPEAATTQPASEQERQRMAQAERARTFRARRIGDVVVYASELTLDQLSKGNPTTQSASAAKALANASKSSAGVQVVLLPDALHFMRDMVNEDDTKSEDPLDKALFKLEWFSLAAQVGKQPSASLNVYCEPGSEKLVKEAFDGALKSVGPDSQWAAVAKSLRVIARDKRVELQLTGEDLARLLVSAVNEPASTQSTTAPTTQSPKR